jgi:arylformamidase
MSTEVRRNYDEQLRIRAVVPDFDVYVERYRALSLETRRQLRHCPDCAYGRSELERLDIFLPQAPDGETPVHIFFHGGYWRAFDKTDYSFVAQPIVTAGAVAIVANYGLMPAVSMAQLIAQCRGVIQWVYANAAGFSANPNRISISGHSAGAHIAAVLALTRWEEFGLPNDVIKSTVSVSGIYELNPILRSFLRDETGLTQEDAARFSPITWAEHSGISSGHILIAFGAKETPEFKRQSLAFSSALQRNYVGVSLLVIEQRHHMDIVLDLGASESVLGHALLDEMLSSSPPLQSAL